MPILASLGAGAIGAYRMFRQVIAVTGGADGIDFDGVNDYLSRASDFSGNIDSGTFTFSAWVWNATEAGITHGIYWANLGGALRFRVQMLDGDVTFLGYNSSGVNILYGTNSTPSLADNTWNHILISVDLSNTSKRWVYVNDVSVGSFPGTYTNSSIDFTVDSHQVGQSAAASQEQYGRLAHVYLDYTYRDLSVSANRRLFVTANLTPATGQETLSPIMYLKLNDSTNPGKNSGTGGDLTLIGNVERSGRGPNQYNVPYSDLSGSGTYMTVNSLSGIADSATFTFACTFNVDNIANDNPRFILYGEPSNTGRRFQVYLSGGRLNVYGYNSAGTDILGVYMQSADLVVGRNYHFVFSVDLSDVSKRHFYLNGQTVNLIWSTYTAQNINFSGAAPRYVVGRNGPSDQWYHDGRLGGVFFHTSYIDLSVASNLAKFVTGTGINAKPVDPGADGSTPLGVQPLIYLPMYGRNAGKNYGSGGDFTVSGGPYPGVRSVNEYWGSYARFDGVNSYLSRSSDLAISDSKIMLISFWIFPNSFDCDTLSIATTSSSGTSLRLYFSPNSGMAQFGLDATNSSGTLILNAGKLNALDGPGAKNHVLISFDLSNASNRAVYINDLAVAVTWSTYTNDFIDLTRPTVHMGRSIGTSYLNGNLSEFYLATPSSYFDISQESNRRKFRDVFGNPVDLGSDGSTPTGTKPAIYMRYDPSSPGTNSGTAGDFTPNGMLAGRSL
jgi:Concanavalin A-like lectin/glucanases superfamily